jgi:ABC-type branched-subunit amino acid transport system ATPase component
VSFGGVRAVDDVSISLSAADPRPHRLTGAAVTFLNAVTGVVPAEGTLDVAGSAVKLGSPGAVRRAGIMRAYQTPQTYLDLTCIENVLLSSADRRYTGIFASTVLRPVMLRHEKERWQRAAEALARVGLLDRAEESAASLSYGQQRLLELARSFAGSPRSSSSTAVGPQRQ